MSMKDYKKLVDGLRHCTTVDGCKGCPFDDPTDLLCECSNKVCTGAADAIESLLKGLHETKSDFKAAVRGQETLQKALADVKAELATAIKALDEALIMDNRECFDGENFPCGCRQWCDLCDENEDRGCAKAYLEWLSSQKEA